MSRGNTIVPIRVPPETLAELDAAIKRSLHTRAGEPWTRTAFILRAIREKLSHQKRSNAPRRKRATGSV